MFFSILARESFPDTDALAERILHFQRWHNQTARPFNWTWTRQRLNDHLHRLGGFNLDA
ncbi:MAG: hypothetical protein LBH76_03495 [Propionibacteriaceae bacterium]|nr:hypothetical protein [Propionibacteriaceae bacterium]